MTVVGSMAVEGHRRELQPWLRHGPEECSDDVRRSAWSPPPEISRGHSRMHPSQALQGRLRERCDALGPLAHLRSGNRHSHEINAGLWSCDDCFAVLRTCCSSSASFGTISASPTTIWERL